MKQKHFILVAPADWAHLENVRRAMAGLPHEEVILAEEDENGTA